MPTASSSSSAAPLLGASRGRVANDAARNRQAELAAAFGGSDDEEEDVAAAEIEGARRHIDGDIMARATNSSFSSSSSPPQYTSSPQRRQSMVEGGDVFFDAGDAIGHHPHTTSDPLGAQRVNEGEEGRTHSQDLHFLPRQQRPSPSEGTTTVREGSYDFERASYFAPPRPTPSRSTSMALHHPTGETSDQDTTIDMGGVAQGSPSSSSVSRLRHALGRFGRLVGMRVPGATYSSLSNEDDHAMAAARRRIMGSGIGQDGVFANLNAKPERRRRRSGDDRGDDDDLVDDVLPPSYETAAADSAPPYWETTIIGGAGGFHPLAPGGAGWTPGGAHVGALEDLIVEGLPIGNFFGFAWNLLVSMSFQFIGFLLTYLLHTTHAARCGSRAGLGITLVQYGFYLRTRAAQMAEGRLPEDIIGVPGADPTTTGDQPHGGAIGAWWTDGSHPQPTPAVGDEVHKLLARGFSFVFRQAVDAGSSSVISNNGTLADTLANDDGSISLPSAESMSASTEWLAYILMGMGWFILLTSLLSYWRVHRWAKQLVDAAHRESEGNSGEASSSPAGENNEQEASSNAPVGFLYTVRNAFRNSSRRSRRAEQTRAHSAEDWIIFPGRPRRDLFSASRTRRSNAEEEDPEAAETTIDMEAASLSTEERRLLEDMRNVGLIN